MKSAPKKKEKTQRERHIKSYGNKRRIMANREALGAVKYKAQ